MWLQGSMVLDETRVYQSKVKRTYEALVASVFPVIQDVFGSVQITFPMYRWAYAILDSRSIWWSGERHLVPMLDMINCDQGPPHGTVHSTDLDDTVSPRVWATTAQCQVV